MMYLIDSDTAIYLIRNNPKVVRKFMEIRVSDWVVSAITAFEIEKGIEFQAHGDAASRAREFLDLAEVESVTHRVAQRAAVIHNQLRKAGRPIGLADELIAAHALEMNLTLVTNNTRHFENVSGLKLENWL